MEKDHKTTIDRVEDVEDDIIKPVLTSDTMGTVTIADAKDIFLVPTPSADPRGALSASFEAMAAYADVSFKIH